MARSIGHIVHQIDVAERRLQGANATSFVGQGITLSAPTNFQGFAGDSLVTLTWDAVANATAYDIEIDGNVTQLGDVQLYNASGLNNDQSYVFRVRARAGAVFSAWTGSINRIPVASQGGAVSILQTLNYAPFNASGFGNGRIGFYIDYSERTAVGEHKFRICRTRGTQGQVTVQYSTHGDPHEAVSGTLTWQAGEAHVQEVVVNVPSKVFSGEHRIWMQLANPNGGAVLHYGVHTRAYGVIDDNSVAPDSEAVFFDADAVSNGLGTSASPYNNPYDAIANVGSKRFIYGRGTIVPDGTDTGSAYSAFHKCVRAPGSRGGEESRCIIRNWPGFTLNYQGDGGNNTFGFLARNNESYHTYRGINFSGLNSTSSSAGCAAIWYHEPVLPGTGCEGITVELCNIDGVNGGDLQGGVCVFGVTGAKIWRTTIANIAKNGITSNANCAGVFSYHGKSISIQRCYFAPTMNAGTFHKLTDQLDVSFNVKFNHFDNCRCNYSISGSSNSAHSWADVQSNLFTGVLAYLRHFTSNGNLLGDGLLFANNVFQGSNAGEDHAIIMQLANGVYIYNNIMLNCRRVWGDVRNDSASGNDVKFADYNHSFGTTYSRNFEYRAVDYFTPGDLFTAVGFEENHAISDPMFNDVGTLDYTLQPGSPCLSTGLGGSDKGIYLSGIEKIGPTGLQS